MAKDCPFCNVSKSDKVWSSELVFAIRDRYPVTEGHTLVIPRRHVGTYFEATPAEQAELWRAVDAIKAELDASMAPDGYNVGFNVGAAAGQTVMHLHVHVIPRRAGDMDDPRGGVRGVIPDRQKYGTPAPRLVTGGSSDPLLNELEPALDGADEVDLAIAFIFDRGVTLLEKRLVDILRRGGRVRIVTGRYQDVTEPAALRHLRALPLIANRDPQSLALRAYPLASPRDSFHPKAWIVRGREARAWVGSSNMSHSALRSGVEWNYRLVARPDVDNVRAGFEALWSAAVPIDAAWIQGYESTRAPRAAPQALPRRAEQVRDEAAADA